MIEYWSQITFKNPYFFFLLALIPLCLAWYIWRQQQHYPELRFPSLQPFIQQGHTWRSVLRHALVGGRLLALTLLIIALARPRIKSNKKEVHTKGIDIIIAHDISSSMLAEDFKPNRIGAAKKVASSFIEERPNDRIGLITFAGESFTQCPLTSDHQVVQNLLQDIKSGMLKDGTAIGMGLATSINRLKDSEAKSKVIILLTDGVNNTGRIDPYTASEMAKKFNIRVYTIGVGSKGTAPYPVQTPFGKQYRQMEVKIDEGLLQEIAQTTGGKYFRATHNKKLRRIYEEIDKLEKTKLEIKKYHQYSEEYKGFALWGVIFFALELLMRYTIFRNLP